MMSSDGRAEAEARKHKDKDKVGLDCLPWPRSGERDYIRECETSTLRASRVEGGEEKARQRRSVPAGDSPQDDVDKETGTESLLGARQRTRRRRG